LKTFAIILPIEQDVYSTDPSVKLRGLNPNANIYIICAIANIHIPAVKQLGHTNNYDISNAEAKDYREVKSFDLYINIHNEYSFQKEINFIYIGMHTFLI